MRSDLFHNRVHHILFGEGNRYKIARRALTGNYTIHKDNLHIYYLDPNGSSRIVTLMAEEDAMGAFFIIVNQADAAEELQVKNDAGGAIVNIPRDEAAVFMCDGVNWHFARWQEVPSGGGGGGGLEEADLPFTTPAFHGALGGDPGTDDGPGLRAAFATGFVVFPDSVTYYVNSQDGTTGACIATTDQSLVVRGNNSRIVRNANFTGWLIRATPQLETEVTAIDTVSFDLSDGDGQSTLVSRLTVDDETGYAIGDLVKVAGDDLLPGFDSGGEAGEFAIVAGIDAVNHYLYLHGILRGSGVYTPGGNTVRVAKFSDSMKIDIDGLIFDETVANEPTYNVPWIWAKNLVHPKFNVRCLTCYGTFFVDNSCYGLRGRAVIENADSKAGVRVSYGVLCQSSEMGTWELDVQRARHGFTTAPRSPAADDYFSRRGWVFGYRVSGTCHGADASGFDFHMDAWSCGFVNCVVQGAFRGAAGVGAGFQLDGRDTWAMGCHSVGNRMGYQLFSRSTDAPDLAGLGPGRNFKLIECHSDDEEFSVLCLATGATDNNIGVEVRGGSYRTRRGVSVFDLTRTDMRIYDTVIHGPDRLAVAGNDADIFTLRSEGKVFARGLEVDLSDSNGTDVRLVNFAGADAVFRGEFDRILGVAGKLTRIVDGGGQATAVADIVVNYADADPAGDLCEDFQAGAVIRIDLRKKGASADRGDASITLNTKDKPYQIFNTPLTADRTVTLNTAGNSSTWAEGQVFRIVRTAAATGAFNLNVGAGPLIQLLDGEWCDVLWDGTAWQLVGYGPLF